MPISMPRNILLVLLAATLAAAPVCQAAGTPINQESPKPAVSAPAALETGTASQAKADDDGYAETAPAPVADPLYRWNKFWFGFNHLFFSGFMRPLAKGYAIVVPRFVRTGLTNAYQNFIFPIRFVNALLQLNFTKAQREFGRFMINSTIGVGGLMDVAKADPNLQPGNEDFGQTLGSWGIGDGFYIVWPFLGPSSARDTVGLAGDAVANPLFWIFGPWAVYGDDNPWYLSYIVKAGDVFNNLPTTLETYDSVTKPAVDPYSAIKDAYIQYRRNAVSQ
ncbi:VacJ family lipoprotein [Solidesulfovibrio sp.]|uniref:MlaA family lipoprotein n=1 Tax=Solidesulfovibrio sp. TaxID=2910990 RepID=UPI00263931BD|nr:VacJ family lipoprotein [Solidesulfovibrio sp.]